MTAVVVVMGLVACGAPTAESPPLTGSWGGDHVALVTTDLGATLEYDCASGTIDDPLIPDAAGRFQARGTHVIGQPGPIRQDDVPDTHPARYDGMIDGDTMTLTVTLTDSATEVGTFLLVKGGDPRIVRCL